MAGINFKKGLATDLANGTATANNYPYTTFNTRTHALSGLTNLTSPITFRIVKTSAGDVMHLYNMQIGGTVTPITLPLTFVSFTAKTGANNIALNISTADEVDTKYLDIEKSADGIRFASIGTLPAGNKPANQYQFTDNNPSTGTNFYRVKQVDLTGTYSYSPVVTAQYGAALQLQLAPNPVQNELQIVTTGGLADKGELTIQTITGSTVKRISVTLSGGAAKVDVSDLKSGSYVVKLVVNNTELTQKFIK